MSDFFPIMNVSDWARVGIEQMGTKRKFWCRAPDGRLWMFKFSRQHAGEDWSEKLAAEIAELLRLPHAVVELANADAGRGIISKDFTEERLRGTLVHGNELLLEADPNYTQNAHNFRVAQHTLDRIFRVLSQDFIHLPDGFEAPEGVASAVDLFVGYLLLDALIGNTDRHHSNWGILEQTPVDASRRAELAPTFDHASSLGRELTDARREEKLRPLRRNQTVVGYLESDPGRSRIFAAEHEPKPLRPMEVFRAAAALRPLAAEAWLRRLADIAAQDFQRLVDLMPEQAMSPSARQFALRVLDLNQMAMLTRRFEYD